MNLRACVDSTDVQNPVQLNASTYPFEPMRPQELRMLSEDFLVSWPTRLNPKLEALKLQTESASFVALAALQSP